MGNYWINSLFLCEMEIRIAEVFNSEPNARLIAAAPDLYEAAKKLLTHFHQSFADAFNETGEIPFVDGYRDLVLALAKVERR